MHPGINIFINRLILILYLGTNTSLMPKLGLYNESCRRKNALRQRKESRQNARRILIRKHVQNYMNVLHYVTYKPPSPNQWKTAVIDQATIVPSEPKKLVCITSSCTLKMNIFHSLLIYKWNGVRFGWPIFPECTGRQRQRIFCENFVIRRILTGSIKIFTFT